MTDSDATHVDTADSAIWLCDQWWWSYIGNHAQNRSHIGLLKRGGQIALVVVHVYQIELVLKETCLVEHAFADLQSQVACQPIEAFSRTHLTALVNDDRREQEAVLLETLLRTLPKIYMKLFIARA